MRVKELMQMLHDVVSDMRIYGIDIIDYEIVTDDGRVYDISTDNEHKRLILSVGKGVGE